MVAFFVVILHRQIEKGKIIFSINPARFGLDPEKRFTNQAQTFATMSKKNVKKSQVAKVKTKLLCMDAEVLTNEKKFAVGDKIKAEVEYVDEDNLRVIQQPSKSKPQTENPERKYHDLVGSLHGKICKTDFGVTLHVYVRHGEYPNTRALADMFESETEQMCDILSEIALCEEDVK